MVDKRCIEKSRLRIDFFPDNINLLFCIRIVLILVLNLADAVHDCRMVADAYAVGNRLQIITNHLPAQVHHNLTRIRTSPGFG